MMDESGQITILLERAIGGDRAAEDELLVRLNKQLRQRAAALLPHADGLIQPTVLVDNAWMKIFHGGTRPEFESRRAFFRYFITAMTHLLRDHVRHRQTIEQGGRFHRTSLDAIVEHIEASIDVHYLDLYDALSRLQAEHPRAHEVVTLYMFWSMPQREIADRLGIGLATVESDWRFARAYLHKELREPGDGI